MTSKLEIFARLTGLVIGAGLVLVLLVAARPTREPESGLPAGARVTVEPIGELDLQPAPPDPLLDTEAIEPGGEPVSAVLSLRNQTGQEMLVGLQGESDVHDLDGLLRVRLSDDGEVLADTTLGGLSNPIDLGALASGEGRQLTLTVWIPGSVADGYQGRQVDVTLVPTAEAAP